MKRETLLTVAVIVLLVMNMATLGFLYWTHVRSPQNTGDKKEPQLTTFEIYEPGDFSSIDHAIIDKLHLDSAQQIKFVEMKHGHHSQMQALDSSYTALLRQYFDLLHSQNVSTEVRDSIESTLAKVQARRASVTFDHFKALKTLCAADSVIFGANNVIAGAASQIAAFDSLLPLLERRLMGTHIEWTPPGYPHSMPLYDNEDGPGAAGAAGAAAPVKAR